ncbi:MULTISPECIES: sodium-dependent transporter [unclassified Methylophaga]|jgi:NSS family neurotransmitter:Na+ symporter|uniref:sodium-dependent transporter n=2 Tax=Methylophaga TaxID=40222 RepID=UPI00259C7C37|nr:MULTISPECIES: sodium-dependent transporter [unclassified Methylophaga]|tara:strand:- start:990 stop:2357 length:1368 start_codon:yes stop_codon:yes gene_type:complete
MARPTKSIHGEWTSRWAFILAATGSAVGLGNIWKFPYIAGENGGGAFVLVYLLCIAIIGVPLMMAEILIGRRGRQNPMNTLKSIAEEEGKSKHWQWLGGMGVLTGFFILSYYSVIAGQAMAYIPRAFAGVFEGVTADGAISIHKALVNDPERLLAWHTIFMLMTVAIVIRGVQHGLEKSVRIIMPALFIIILMLVGYGYNTGEYFHQSMDFLFATDFSKLTHTGVLTAMGHAFFTLSLGMGAIMVYGSYLPQKASIFKVSLTISVMDTGVALLAGLAIFPLVFANGLEPGQGPSLIFDTLPIAFGHMPGGEFFGGIFFVLLLFAAWSSGISLVEPIVVWLVENKNMTRLRASVYSGAIIWLLGLLTIFSFNIGREWTLFGLTMFELLDYLTANIMLPLGGLLIAFFAGWVMKRQSSMDELGLGNGVLYSTWRVLVRFITPIAIMIVFANLIGLLN